ncbi:MAG TPA: LuxR C-terminal-related transcriptional regulator, partial [Propionibacteriaceae bacterium]|nr:LuxR C-terminal-related transcriptional regulator [Propionibacteriaceae bacterium]
DSAIPRTRLANCLDAGAAGPLTMITAPQGAGKTIGVASWALGLHPSVGVIWVGLRDESIVGLPLDQISAELVQHRRAVLVCDDFPAAPSISLLQDLEILLSQPDRGLSIVLISSTPLTVPTHPTLASADLTTINLDDLVMDEKEVRLVLDQHGVTASETTIRAILEHTAGWAAGVGLAVDTLAQLSRSTPAAVRSDDRQAARSMVRSLAVARILAGAGSEVVQQVIQVKEFAESEPLLLAAAALSNSWVDVTESALARATFELAQTHEPEVADVLSVAVLNMAMSKQRADAAGGLAQASHAKDLMTHLTLSERAQAPEISPLIDYYVAGFELLRGNVGAARWTLERAGRFHQSRDSETNHAEHLVRASCTGLLSWIDAFCGDLRRAVRCATSLLTDRRADSGEIGVRFAHLATAWVHMERGEFEQASQRLDHAQSTSTKSLEPMLAAVERLTQVRLALVTEEPEIALRLLQSTKVVDCPIRDGWLSDQFLVATAEAWLAAGEPQQAIATLTPESGLAAVEARLLLARALRIVGDLDAAKATLAEVPSDSVAMSVVAQVQRWLLLAQLPVEHGNDEQPELLVHRALRAAAREQLRTTISWDVTWLRCFVTRDSGLSLRYAAFLASMPDPATAVDHRRADDHAYGGVFVVPLTTRETDVLRLLAQLCSNEEIAADLVLSLNTVKTHMRSLFQKLSVSRRADAVRRGRALGIC